MAGKVAICAIEDPVSQRILEMTSFIKVCCCSHAVAVLRNCRFFSLRVLVSVKLNKVIWTIKGFVNFSIDIINKKKWRQRGLFGGMLQDSVSNSAPAPTLQLLLAERREMRAQSFTSQKTPGF